MRGEDEPSTHTSHPPVARDNEASLPSHDDRTICVGNVLRSAAPLQRWEIPHRGLKGDPPNCSMILALDEDLPEWFGRDAGVKKQYGLSPRTLVPPASVAFLRRCPGSKAWAPLGTPPSRRHRPMSESMPRAAIFHARPRGPTKPTFEVCPKLAEPRPNLLRSAQTWPNRTLHWAEPDAMSTPPCIWSKPPCIWLK